MEQPERWRAFDVLGHLDAVTAVNHLAQALALSVTARVALHLADANGVAKNDLAKLVGVARATLQRAFDEAARADAIKTGYRAITRRAKALERFVSRQ